MIKRIKDSKGNSLIELIMVMMLLVLFGCTIGAVVVSGSQAQNRIQSRKNAQIDARIALNFITVRLRQSDKKGALFFATEGKSGGDALVIRNIDEMNPINNYDQWIYFSQGHVYEEIVDIDEQPDDDYAFTIVDVTDLKLEFDTDRGVVRNTVSYVVDGTTYSISNTVRLKAGGTK